MTRLHGLYDPAPVNDWLREREGRLAFDVGANGGEVANMLAVRFDKVIACEPAKESYRHLELDARLNVVPVDCAVSDHDGTVVLQEASKSLSMGQLVTAGGGMLKSWGQEIGDRTVVCRCLDTLAAIYGCPDFLKVDVEGHEVQVLEGGAAVLEERPMLCVEVHTAENGQRVRSLLKAYDLREERHPKHTVSEHDYVNHYWLLGVPR